MSFPNRAIPFFPAPGFTFRMLAELQPLTSLGHELETYPSAWGELQDSSDLLGDPVALVEGMDANGYLYIRNFFPREIIEAARLSFLTNLAGSGIFEREFPLEDGVLKSGKNPNFAPEAARGSDAVKRVVFGSEIKSFYEGFLGGPIRHFDYIWVRAKGHGKGTEPHCDIVYMGRGTHQLYTAWIPYGDVPYDIGGLMLLEKSHLKAGRIRNYLNSDVDTYCENVPGRDGWKFNGALSNNPHSLRQKLGGRWLSAEFQMGDLLTFRMDTVHASLDNQTNRIRLSTDTRYQRADQPVDERWIGENPIAHGVEGKRGLIC